MAILSYIIVSAKSIRDLEEKVSKYMTQGHKPIGGVTIEQDIQDGRVPRIKNTYYQVVIFSN